MINLMGVMMTGVSLANANPPEHQLRIGMCSTTRLTGKIVDCQLFPTSYMEYANRRFSLGFNSFFLVTNSLHANYFLLDAGNFRPSIGLSQKYAIDIGGSSSIADWSMLHVAGDYQTERFTFRLSIGKLVARSGEWHLTPKLESMVLTLYAMYNIPLSKN